MTTKERLDKIEELLTHLTKLTIAMAQARRQENPAYPFHPAMRLNEGMKLIKQVNEMADNLGVPETEVVEAEKPTTPETETT